MAGLLDFIGDDDDWMTASAKANSPQPLPGLLDGSGLLGGSTMAYSQRSWPPSWWNSAAALPTTNSTIERTPTQAEPHRGVERTQVLPDNFEIGYTQQSLTPDEARARWNAADPKEYLR